MQKWEYLTAHVAPVGKGDKEEVTQINDASFHKCPDWISFLATVGQEGWELVGLVRRGNISFEAVFKRPKE